MVRVRALTPNLPPGFAIVSQPALRRHGMVPLDHDTKAAVILPTRFLFIPCFSNVSSNYDLPDTFRWAVKYLMKGTLTDQ